MKPKYSEVLKAWADGIKCQYWCPHHKEWSNIHKLSIFDDYDSVRIKPEPKPDIVQYYYADSFNELHLSRYENSLKVVFDGETGKPKSAEVIL
jgi:hypothetical protein